MTDTFCQFQEGCAKLLSTPQLLEILCSPQVVPGQHIGGTKAYRRIFADITLLRKRKIEV